MTVPLGSGFIGHSANDKLLIIKLTCLDNKVRNVMLSNGGSNRNVRSRTGQGMNMSRGGDDIRRL